MLKDFIQNIPNLPGSYQFKNKDGIVIYVGKAKDLKKRVSSYFTGSHDTKTSRLIMNIAEIEKQKEDDLAKGVLTGYGVIAMCEVTNPTN